MAKENNQKLKLVYLIRFFLEKTDENHRATMGQILSHLESLDIKAERKSIYNDIENIRKLGIDVTGEKAGRGFEYYVGSREFEVAELKLLADAIQSSKFITEKKSHQLIKKLQKLVSIHDAKQLQRHVYVAGRSKTINEKVLYSIDTIHNAINTNRQISFQYFNWNIKKQMELRRGGALYKVSPWALCWEDENYYLIGFDSKHGQIRHYRVDKMINISAMDTAREGKDFFDRFNMAEYSKKSFGMFAGEEETVKLLVHNSLIGVMIDRFGTKLMIFPEKNEHVRINVKVAVSKQFFGWIFGLGNRVKILGPDHVAEQMKEHLQRILSLYQ